MFVLLVRLTNQNYVGTFYFAAALSRYLCYRITSVESYLCELSRLWYLFC